jgi:hypothetical protein
LDGIRKEIGMLNLQTSYGCNLYTLGRYLSLLKTGGLSKAEKESLLRDCRELANKVNIRLGRYNSNDFGKAVFNRLAAAMSYYD